MPSGPAATLLWRRRVTLGLARRTPVMTRTVRLRPWQKAALDRFLAADERRLPGRRHARRRQDHVRPHRGPPRARPRRPSRLVVVAPTAHLKIQWARAAAALVAPPRPGLVGRRRRPARPTCTASSPPTSRSPSAPAPWPRLAPGAFVVLDEIHHAGDERAWGDADPARLRRRRAGAWPCRARRSAPTPARSRSSTYRGRRGGARLRVRLRRRPGRRAGRAAGLLPAHRRPHGVDRRPTASLHAATFDDALDAARVEPAPAHRALARRRVAARPCCAPPTSGSREIRREQPDAGGLVIAIDQEHARGIADAAADALRHARRASATSDDPGASARIAHFAHGGDPWLVAVRMVSEGVDIPRLRVGVYATTTVDRAVLPPGRRPLRALDARACRASRRTCSSPTTRGCGRWPARSPSSAATRCAARTTRRCSSQQLDEELPAQPDEEQLSLFAVISAVATDAAEPDDDELWRDLDALDERPSDEIELALAPPPPLPGRRRRATAEPGVDAPRAEAAAARRQRRPSPASWRAAPG